MKHKIIMFTSACRVSRVLLLLIYAMGNGEDRSTKAPGVSHFRTVPEHFPLKAASPEPSSKIPSVSDGESGLWLPPAPSFTG